MKVRLKHTLLVAALVAPSLTVQARDVACPAFKEKTVFTTGFKFDTYNSIAVPLSGALARLSTETSVGAFLKSVPFYGHVPVRAGASMPTMENRTGAIEVVQSDNFGRTVFYMRGTRGDNVGDPDVSHLSPTVAASANELSLMRRTNDSSSIIVESMQSAVSTFLPPPGSTFTTMLYISVPRDRQLRYNINGVSGVDRYKPTCTGISFL